MKPTVPKLDRDLTMRVVAEEWIDNRIKSGQWKCLTHPGQVRQRLRDHVYPVAADLAIPPQFPPSGDMRSHGFARKCFGVLA